MGNGVSARRCPFCGGELVNDVVARVACFVCHRQRCLGYDQTAPTVLVLELGVLTRRRDLERLLAVDLRREQKIEES